LIVVEAFALKAARWVVGGVTSRVQATDQDGLSAGYGQRAGLKGLGFVAGD
jgi:hypothetical protein